MSKLKLTLDLVPETCWFSNVRAVVTKSEWDFLRAKVYSSAYSKCEICGGVGLKHPVECHEVWSYDIKNLIQKLEKMVALCPSCHMVKHMGLAEIRGKKADAMKHFQNVNNITSKMAEKHVKDAFLLWKQRSEKQWKLDISHLQEYGIDISKYAK